MAAGVDGRSVPQSPGDDKPRLAQGKPRAQISCLSSTPPSQQLAFELMRRPRKPASRSKSATVDTAVREHDASLRRRGVTVWLGAEPTFTDRLSVAPEWRTEPLGEDKLNRARRFAAEVLERTPGALLLRTVGRQYAGEPAPRWSLGVYALRRGRPGWRVPGDPIQTGRITRRPAWRRFVRTLQEELESAGFSARLLKVAADLPERILFAKKAGALRGRWKSDARVSRDPLDAQPTPLEGVRDELADQGLYLAALGPCLSEHPGDSDAIQLELPRFGDVATFTKFLKCVGHAARRTRLPSLIFTGYPPPVDPTVAWTTLTPDPGVLEVNMAPSPDVRSFLAAQRLLHAAAGHADLSAFNLLYNGEETDSGGGQHLTFGGRTPACSPFFEQPLLLPRLIAYLNEHPSLSYWFAGQSVGSSSQQPRSDEVSAESFEGLCVALDLLQARRGAQPHELWSSLAPFLTDRFGNTHRAEINVEKLWNPYAPGRGKSGLVELRAFGMTATAEDAAAVAMLMRGVIAMLASGTRSSQLRLWGEELHDRFALPFHLQRDLQQVLDDLRRAGFGLPGSIRDGLLNDTRRVLGRATFGEVELVVRRAQRFWPLTGSLSESEGASRWVDPSTQRLELLLKAPRRKARDLARWRLVIDGMEIPWVMEQDSRHAYALRGVRYKSFHPQLPLLPLVKVVEPFRFWLLDGAEAWGCTCAHWQPEGSEYPGLPQDDAEARRRREARFQVRPSRAPRQIRPVPANALAPFTLDLRRVYRRS